MKRWNSGLQVKVGLVDKTSYQDKGFVTIKDSSFVADGRPYYYIGTNYWYGAIIASSGKFGDRPRLIRELDQLKKIGVNNLRLLVGAEGPDGEPFRVTPALQIAPGKYNEELLDGLDFLLSEMKKRGQYAILYLNNSWEWSGGYAQYLNWNGYGTIPYPSVKPNTRNQFYKYAARFLNCPKCKEQFEEQVRFIVGRTNNYTGVKYTDDTSIMTWEIGNEPRAFSPENIPAFEEWISNVASLIKELDKNHLVTTGTEGQQGCEKSMELFERIHSNPDIDYLTIHVWPKNWKWLDPEDISSTMDVSIMNTNIYIQDHLKVALQLNKPIVLEEFGLPRDFHGYSPEETTFFRNRYYRNVFEQLLVYARQKSVFAGCNFWTYAGEGRPVKGQTHWKSGDDYLGDPPIEEQGLNSVFNTDTTISLIAGYNRKLKKLL
jgi:mannan endo-1,4-beta-mannosidase